MTGDWIAIGPAVERPDRIVAVDIRFLLIRCKPGGKTWPRFVQSRHRGKIAGYVLPSFGRSLAAQAQRIGSIHRIRCGIAVKVCSVHEAQRILRQELSDAANTNDSLAKGFRFEPTERHPRIQKAFPAVRRKRHWGRLHGKGSGPPGPGCGHVPQGCNS